MLWLRYLAMGFHLSKRPAWVQFVNEWVTVDETGRAYMDVDEARVEVLGAAFETWLSGQKFNSDQTLLLHLIKEQIKANAGDFNSFDSWRFDQPPLVHETLSAAKFFAEAARAMKSGASLLLAEPAGHVSNDDFENELSLAAEVGLLSVDRPRISRSNEPDANATNAWCSGHASSALSCYLAASTQARHGLGGAGQAAVSRPA
jgi:hypothetical protein